MKEDVERRIAQTIEDRLALFTPRRRSIKEVLEEFFISKVLDRNFRDWTIARAGHDTVKYGFIEPQTESDIAILPAEFQKCAFRASLEVLVTREGGRIFREKVE